MEGAFVLVLTDDHGHQVEVSIGHLVTTQVFTAVVPSFLALVENGAQELDAALDHLLRSIFLSDSHSVRLLKDVDNHSEEPLDLIHDS